MANVRVVLLALFAALVLWAGTLKLYLKDGGYHLVREYQVEGDRVRFYSTERGEWEEMPTALIDLDKTQQEAKREAELDKKEQRAQDEEDQALREQQKEIASVPMETGAYFRVNAEVKKLDAASYQVVTNKKRAALKMLSPIPLIPGKASVVIKGEHSPFVVHDERPTFYFRPEKEEQFTIISVQPKKNYRVVENVSIVPVANAAVEDRRVVKVFQQQLAGNLYKVWPEKAIEPGEYALVEFSDSDANTKDELDLLVWDFAYRTSK
jgi:hypothetical protein